MNITGVTTTTPAMTIPSLQGYNQDQAQYQDLIEDAASTPSSNAINVSMAASIQVMDLAQSAFTDAAEQLISSMSAATGIGQNVNMLV